MRIGLRSILSAKPTNEQVTIQASLQGRVRTSGDRRATPVGPALRYVLVRKGLRGTAGVLEVRAGIEGTCLGDGLSV